MVISGQPVRLWRKKVRSTLSKGRYSPQGIKSSIKFGGWSVMVFGMILGSCRLHDNIDVTVYKEKLKKNVPNVRTAINQPAVFIQDNTPCHTVKSVKTSLSEEGVTDMEWPVQNPDMNPIKNVWKLLNERAKEKNPRNLEKYGLIWKDEKEKIILLV